MPDNVSFYKYAHNDVWLRETLVAITFNRAIVASPLLNLLNATFGKIKLAGKSLTKLKANVKAIIDSENPYSNETLSLLLGVCIEV